MALLAATLLLLVRARGVCCYDDAALALVSKNLAEGRGYSLPFYFADGQFRRSLFDPLIGTGPVSIVPVAAAIRIFGAEYWVPGATHLLCELLFLGLIVFVLARRFGYPRALLYVAGSWLLIIALSARHLEQWYAQLGE